MTTRTMGHIVLGVGLLATAVLLLTAVSGLRIAVDAELVDLRPHLLQGLVAVLLLILSHAWVVLFLVAGSWALRASAREAGVAISDTRLQRRRLTRAVLPLALLAVTLAVVSLLVGTRTFTDDLGVAWHRWLAWSTVGIQCLAWIVEWRGLSAFDGDLRRLRPTIEAPLGADPEVDGEGGARTAGT